MHVTTRKSAIPRLVSDVLLQTFRAWISTPSSAATPTEREQFDNGSPQTFIRKDVVTKLKLAAIGEMDLAVSAFGKTAGPKQTFNVVRATLRSQHERTSVDIEAIVLPFICEDMAETLKGTTLLQRLVAKGKPLDDAVSFPGMEFQQGVSVLVGSDQIWKFMPQSSQVKRHDQNPSLVTIETSMRWTLQGPLSLNESGNPKCRSHVCVLCTDTQKTEEFSSSFRGFREEATVGIMNPLNFHRSGCKSTDEIVFQNGRYEVQLQQKSSTPFSMDKDRKIAISRPKRVPGRLSPNEEDMRQCQRNDHTEKIVDRAPSPDHVHYVAHREVLREASRNTRFHVTFNTPLLVLISDFFTMEPATLSLQYATGAGWLEAENAWRKFLYIAKCTRPSRCSLLQLRPHR